MNINECINKNDLVEYNGCVYQVVAVSFNDKVVTLNNGEVVSFDDFDKVDEVYFTDLVEFDENGHEIDNDWDNGIEDTMCGYDLSAEVAISLVMERHPNKSVAMICPCEFDLYSQKWVIPSERKVRTVYTNMEKSEITTIDLSDCIFVTIDL